MRSTKLGLFIACGLITSCLAKRTNDYELKAHRKCTKLSQKLETTFVPTPAQPVVGNVNVHFGYAGWYKAEEVYMTQAAVAPNGDVYVGWKGADRRLYVSSLDSDLKKRQNDVAISGTLLKDLHARDDGFAAMAYARSTYNFHRHNRDGKRLWARNVSANNYIKPKHMAQLAHFPGSGYAVYFGNHRSGHEGDALQFYSENGQRRQLRQGWSWGCSHSIDLRVRNVDGRIIPVCLSDVYPKSGIVYNNKIRLAADKYQYNGFGMANIGGMIEYKDHIVIAFTTAYNRGGRKDVALVGFHKNNPKQIIRKTWITATTRASENRVKIAKLGDKLMLLWSEEGNRYNMVASLWDFELDPRRGFVGKEVAVRERLPIQIDPNADIAEASNGDVVFASPGPNKTLRVQRFRPNCGYGE